MQRNMVNYESRNSEERGAGKIYDKEDALLYTLGDNF